MLNNSEVNFVIDKATKRSDSRPQLLGDGETLQRRISQKGAGINCNNPWSIVLGLRVGVCGSTVILLRAERFKEKKWELD